MANPEDTIYPDLVSVQEALDRGETVRIEMQPLTIDSALVQLAQDLQDKERLEQLHRMYIGSLALYQNPDYNPHMKQAQKESMEGHERAFFEAQADYKETHREEYHEFLDATVDDPEYNAYLDHLNTPKASDY